MHKRLVNVYLLNVPSVSSPYFNKIKRTSHLGKWHALSLEILSDNISPNKNFEYCPYPHSNALLQLSSQIGALQSKYEGKYQESIQSGTTLNLGHHMRKSQNTRKHHIQESPVISPFPTSDHKAAINRQESMTNMNHK